MFGFRARTSRGLMPDKTSWFIKLESLDQPGVTGWGECGPLPGLSVDDRPDFEEVLDQTLRELSTEGLTSLDDIYHRVPPELPALRFGLETAWLDLMNGGKRVVFDNAFVRGLHLPINGLIWMGELDFMMEQIAQKVSAGFRTIKMKVGGLDFERECEVLSYIRRRYYREDITLRLDANGAFKPEDALARLRALAAFDIHSIEQPIRPGLEEMEEVCRQSPIPVAFDEELIGITDSARMKSLLKKLRPHYIILKPSLHGGIKGTREWIAAASDLNIGWWITSALESSIGLNAICQLTAEFNPAIPQGLGTGMIYTNNYESPLTVADGHIFYDERKSWGEIS